jgi:uncharacterized protein YndB with AHSA1/START domain
MPKQKDLKRLVRSRMKKTGEAYTAARLRLVRKKETIPDYARVAGMSDASVRSRTDRTWREWVNLLDASGCAEKPHREIVARVSSQGVGDWWSQMVTVGYERIRGLRDRGQRRGGGYEATKSRTFPVSVETLFEAFADPRRRGRWLPVKVAVKSATAPKRMRMAWNDGSRVVLGFYPKGQTRSSVAIAHENLPDRAASQAMKTAWAAYFDRLGQLLS